MIVPASETTALAVLASARTPTSVIISNLAYLVGAVVLAILVTTVVAIHHRRPRSTEDDMNDFSRSLAALNPDRGPNRHAKARRTATRLEAPTRLETTVARPQLRPQRVPFNADGSAPRRPSTRSGSG